MAVQDALERFFSPDEMFDKVHLLEMPLLPDGQIPEPFVSVPMATTVRSAATATADPLDEPQGVRNRS